MGYKVTEEKGTSRPFVVTNTRDGSVVARAITREDADNIVRNKKYSDHKDTGLDTEEIQAAAAEKAEVKSGVTDEDGNTRPATPEEHAAAQAESEVSDEPVAPDFEVVESHEQDGVVFEKRVYDSGSTRYVRVSNDGVETIKKADFEAAGEPVEPEADSEPTESEAPADEEAEARATDTESEPENEQPASEDSQEDSSTPEESEQSDGGSDADSEQPSQSEGEQQ